MECRGGRQQGQGGPESGPVQTGGVERQKARDVPGWVLTGGGGRRPRPTEQDNGSAMKGWEVFQKILVSVFFFFF